MSDVKFPTTTTMLTIKSKGKSDTDKLSAVNGSIDKRPEPSAIKSQLKDVASAVDHSTKNGSNKDDYRNNKTAGSYYRSNRVLLKNRSYSGEHSFGSRKYNDDVPKKREESFDSRSTYYSSYRNGQYLL